MSEHAEYRGVIITIPGNDDGAWRWAAHHKKGVRSHSIPWDAPRAEFKTRNAAVFAAKLTIDEFLKRRAPREVQEDDADA
jgi:hypothetical protein